MLPDAPRPIGGVLDAGIRFYREQFVSLTRLTATWFGLVLLVDLVFIVFFDVRVAMVDPEATSLGELYTTPMIVMTVIGAVINAFVFAAILCHLIAVREGRTPTLGEASRAGLSRLVPVAVTFVLYLLALMVGFVLLVVPGIWLGTALGLCSYAVVDGCGPIDAMKRSMQLVRGNWWRTTILFSVVLLISIILSLAISLVPGLIFGFTAAATGPSLGLEILSLVLNLLAATVYYPFAFAAGFAIYHDLVLRQSGDDLDARLDALEG